MICKQEHPLDLSPKQLPLQLPLHRLLLTLVHLPQTLPLLLLTVTAAGIRFGIHFTVTAFRSAFARSAHGYPRISFQHVNVE